MANWYVHPGISSADEGDSFVGEFGTGKLRDLWSDVSWVSGDRYYGARDQTAVGTVNVTTGGASEAARIVIAPYGPGNGYHRLDANGAQFGWFVTGTQSFVTVRGLEVFNCNNANAIGMYKATGAGADVRFEDCYVHDILGTNAVGLKMFCDRGKYMRNVVRRVTADGIFIEGDNAECAYNDIDEIDLGNSLGDCVQVADTTISSDNPNIHHNTLRHEQTESKQCVVIQTSGSSGGLVALNDIRGKDHASHKTVLILQQGVQVVGNLVSGGLWGIGLQGANSLAAGNVVLMRLSTGIGILVDAVGARAFNNTAIYLGEHPSAVPGISHFSGSNTGCEIRNNISHDFGYGIRRHSTACTASHNAITGSIGDLVDENLAAAVPDSASWLRDVREYLDAAYRLLPTVEIGGIPMRNPLDGAGVWVQGGRTRNGSPLDPGRVPIGAYMPAGRMR